MPESQRPHDNAHIAPGGRVIGIVWAMTIVPDTKDWTWVLQRPCPECGLDTQSFPRDAIGGMIRANAAAWHALLSQPGDTRLRLSPEKWSALEYACHVRDVLRLYEQRLQMMLTQEGPQFPNWDQDATAVADRYGEQDPAVVAGRADRSRRGDRGALRHPCCGSMAAHRYPQRWCPFHCRVVRAVLHPRPGSSPR